MDLLDETQPGRNTPEFSVSEIAGTVRKLVEAELGWVRVRGEVGRVTLARSGHLYFDLKDDRSVLSCMTWKGQVAAIGVMPEEGMEIVAEGRMTASGFQSKFALNAQQVMVAGQGALMALLEKRKKALAAEGLFDADRKRPIPYLPGIIGVVTSLQGAVIRDILHRLRDRFPRKVLIWPVAVQGAACAPEVVRAIEGFNKLDTGGAMPRPDLLIVARGGGSVEDLWGFNEEAVARAAAASDIPLISAVGHETDTTLIDFVADRRAPTPTAAAEMAVPVRLDLMSWLQEADARLQRGLLQALDRRKQRLRDLARALPQPDRLLDAPRQRLDRADRLETSLRALVDRRRLHLAERTGGLRVSAVQQQIAALSDRLRLQGDRLRPALARVSTDNARRLTQVAHRLRPELVKRDLLWHKDSLHDRSGRLADVTRLKLNALREQIETLDRLRLTLGYEATLQRGYAVIRSNGEVVTTRAAADQAPELEIQFADGHLTVKSRGSRKKKTETNPGEQRSLF